MNHLRQIGVLAILVLVCVGAYWEIATFQNSLKWDMLDCYFPWRFIVGESIQHRIFPFWNPYQHLGYPIHADMRSVFYPEAILVGLFGGYNLKVLHFLFIFYISMAGLGIYTLAGLFLKREFPKLLAAISYVLCGFFVGHGQEMFGIIAATWIPWVLHYFIRFQRHGMWADLWKLLFFLFLQLTGGYQALSLMLFYLLLALGLAEFIPQVRTGQWKNLLFKNLALASVLLVSLSVLIVTYVQVSPNVDRLTGMSLQDTYFGSLTPQSLLSLIAPFSVAADGSFLGTDSTMANVYVGLLVMALFLVGLFQRKGLLLNIILIFGIVCLLASLGPSTPMRAFLYHYVPGMNLFRMSSFFSYFSQLAFILVAAHGFEQMLKKPETRSKWLLRSSVVVLLATLVIAVTTYFDQASGANVSLDLLLGPFRFTQDMSYHQRLFMHTALQVMLLLLFIGSLLVIRRRPTAIAPTILVFVLVEMFISARLNFPATVGDHTPPAQTQAKLDRQPKGFPFPSLDGSIAQNTEYKPEISPLYHNTNTFTKTNSWDGFNSFQLARFQNFTGKQEADYLNDIKNPFLFSTAENTSIEFLEYGPDEMLCEINAHSAMEIVLQQIFYPGWEVRVDGNPAELNIYHDAYSSVRVEEGKHTVTFRYVNAPVKYGFFISYLLFGLIVAASIFHLLRTYTGFGQAMGGTVVIVLVSIGLLGFEWSRTATMASHRMEGYHRLSSLLSEQLSSGDRLFLQVERPEVMDSVLRSLGVSAKATFINGRTRVGQAELLTALGTDSSASRLIYAGSMLPTDETTLAYLRAHFALESTTEVGREFIHVFSKNPPSEMVFHALNDFEGPNAAWNYDLIRVDSAAQAFSGRFGWRIRSEQPGSPGLTIRVGDVTDDPKPTLLFGLKALVPSDSVSNAGLWMVVERDGKQHWSRAKDIKPSAPDAEHWFETVLMVKPDSELKPDDTIKVFVWGGEGDALHIDDTWFALFPAK